MSGFDLSQSNMGRSGFNGRGSGCSGGGFSASSVLLLSPSFWLKADVGLFQERTGASATTPAVADLDPVGTRLDQSGGARHVIATADSKRPLLKLGVTPSGRNAILFDGIDDFLLKTSVTFPGETGRTVFVVASRVGTPAFGMMVVNRDTVYELRWNAAGDTPDTTKDTAAGNLTYGSVVSGWHVYEYVFSDAGNSIALAVDGTAEVTASDSTDLVAIPTDVISLGARADGSVPFAGYMSDVLIFPYALSAGERSQVRSYLRALNGTP